MNELVARDEKGRFVPGQSGNPAGKSKGVRNYITHERLMLEAGLRDYVADPKQSKKLLAGIDRILDIATKTGEDGTEFLSADKDALSAMKLLLDRVMPSMPPKEQEDAERSQTKLEIVIVTNPGATVPVQVIDGECTVLSEETPNEQRESETDD